MSALTPWRSYVTSTPRAFSVVLEQDWLSVHTPGVAAYANPSRSRFQVVMDSSTTTPAPFRVPVKRWQSPKIPIVVLHPLAIPHLLATEQVNRDELKLLLEKKKVPDILRMTVSIEAACPLLTSLRRPRACLRFGTNFDLGVRS